MASQMLKNMVKHESLEFGDCCLVRIKHETPLFPNTHVLILPVYPLYAL